MAATRSGAQSGTQNGGLGAPQLEALSDKLSQTLRDLGASDPGSPAGEASRRTAIETARAILKGLADTTDADRWTAQVVEAAVTNATRAFDKLGGFRGIPEEGSISYTELAKKLDANPTLIRRLAWVLVSKGVLTQLGSDRVAHTEYSLGFVGPEAPNSAMQDIYADHHAAMTKLPEFFEKYGRGEPSTRTHSPYSFAYGQPELTLWEIMAQRPDQGTVKSFMKTMAALESKMPLAGVYDFSWIADAAATTPPDRVLLVDVGGNMGHITKSILSSAPGIPRERCVLQDRPEVIASVEKLDDPELRGVQKVPIDFHKAQPTKGAVAYFIRRILHDYGDEECVEIIGHVAAAMAPDSKLLIAEQVVANPPHATVAAADFAMLLIGGKERTLEEFAEIARRCGLKIAKFYPHEGTSTGVMECVKA